MQFKTITLTLINAICLLFAFKIYLEIVRFWHSLVGLQPHVNIAVERAVSRWERVPSAVAMNKTSFIISWE